MVKPFKDYIQDHDFVFLYGINKPPAIGQVIFPQVSNAELDQINFWPDILRYLNPTSRMALHIFYCFANKLIELFILKPAVF